MISFQLVTTLHNIALEIPCGTWNNAPIGRDMPCTNATEAFVNAIPACKEPSDIASLAARSLPLL